MRRGFRSYFCIISLCLCYWCYVKLRSRKSYIHRLFNWHLDHQIILSLGLWCLIAWCVSWTGRFGETILYILRSCLLHFDLVLERLDEDGYQLSILTVLFVYMRISHFIFRILFSISWLKYLGTAFPLQKYINFSNFGLLLL